MLKVIMTLVLGISIAQAMNFEDYAANILQKSQTEFEKTAVVNLLGKTKMGHACEVKIYNTTGLNPSFPSSSKDSQKIQVSVTVQDPSVRVPTANFRFDRKSVTHSFRTTPYILNLTVLNQTYGLSRKMYQSLNINLSPSNSKHAMIQVSDFSAAPGQGNTLACAGYFQ